MAPPRSNNTSPRSQGAALSARVLAGARDAESTARREREVQEGHREALAGHEGVDGLDDDDEEEVTTEVFEVELTGGSPWATAFLECASEGDLATVTKLLDEGKVELNDVDVDGFTALMIAAAEAQTDVAMELLRRGADVSIRTHEMRSTALHFAAKSGVAPVVDAICTQDPQRIDAQNLDGDTPLVWACTEGRVDAVRVLIKHNANVNVVSHRAMSALICAVMMREGDDSENEGDDDEEEEEPPSKAEDATGTDADRAEIVRLLLSKNAKLVNYQDRDGSTAMHLAASHGYIECVKALLEFGADITLRNAIGQTPVEEAEETGVPGKSDVCIEYLRVIWKRLEDEAAARMMAMLEMEESNHNAGAANAKTSGKKSKKKAKKAKQRRGSKAVVTTSASSPNAEKAAASSGEGSSDDEDEERVDRKPDTVKVEDEEMAIDQMSTAAQTVESVADKDSVAPDGGVWTTVGRKHNQYLSQKAADVSVNESGAVESKPGGNGSAVDSQGTETDSAALAPKKVLPVTPRSRNQRPAPSSSTTPTPAPTPASTPRSRDERSTSAAKKVTPVTPRVKSNRPRPVTDRAPLPSPAAAYPPSTTLEPSPSSTAASTPPLPMGSPFSTFQSLYNTSRLYERYERYPETTVEGRSRGLGFTGASSASSLWRSAAPATSLHSYNPSFSLASAANTQHLSSVSSPTTIWQYSSDRSADLSVRHLPDAVSDKVLRFLICGLCGVLVSDNLQCHNNDPPPVSSSAHSINQSRATPCLQLYCASCVARAVNTSTRGAALHCTKCRHPIQPQKMQRNEFAQVQAAAVALSARSKASQLQQQQLHQQQQRSTLEEMRYLMQRTDEKVQALDIDPFYLTPGANFAALSVGQLDALEELHHSALRQITQARVENARAIERLRMEEWLKTQRDIFQYTTHTHTAASAATASTQQQQQQQ